MTGKAEASEEIQVFARQCDSLSFIHREDDDESAIVHMVKLIAARDARLRAEWEAKVKTLIELIGAEIVSEEPYTSAAYIRGKVSAWRNALVFIRALLADQPGQLSDAASQSVSPSEENT
jgi:hypothetical protein